MTEKEKQMKLLAKLRYQLEAAIADFDYEAAEVLEETINSLEGYVRHLDEEEVEE